MVRALREVFMTRRLRVVLCLDDEGGMTFFGKRQSRDRVLIDELCSSTDGMIYISSFSSHLFGGHEDRVSVCRDPLSECPDGATVFVENLALKPYADEIEEILLYRWNRLYPSDKKIDISFDGFRVISKKEFVGSSHDKITKLILRVV